MNFAFCNVKLWDRDGVGNASLNKFQCLFERFELCGQVLAFEEHAPEVLRWGITLLSVRVFALLQTGFQLGKHFSDPLSSFTRVVKFSDFSEEANNVFPVVRHNKLNELLLELFLVVDAVEVV